MVATIFVCRSITPTVVHPASSTEAALLLAEKCLSLRLELETSPCPREWWLMRRLGLVVVLVVVACSSPTGVDPRTPELPVIDPAALNELLTSLDRPAVVNIWASWCLPCRAEAPLLQQAHASFGDQVEFIGIAYNDNQPGARQFLDEFDLPFPHYFDQPGEIIAELGGFGVPRTYFFAPGGELIETHNGVIDEQTLALQLDELLAR